MHIGLTMFATQDAIQPQDLAREAEARGFESLWQPEHSHIPTSRKSPWPGGAELPKYYYESYDPFVSLAAAAAATKRIKLGTGICLVIQRDPVHTAKEVSTVDRLSSGRFLFGIGAGWNAEEMANHGTAFETRFKLMRERILAMKEIWTKDKAKFAGEFVKFDEMMQWPKPVQKPHPPIIVGGGFPHAAKRAIAYGDGWMPVGGRQPDPLEVLPQFRKMARDAGRDPASLSFTVFAAPRESEVLKRYRDAGVDRSILMLPPKERDAILPMLDQSAALVPGTLSTSAAWTDPMHSIEQEADRLLAALDPVPLPQLLEAARALGREGHGNVISYSRKVFIPLTRLCRDVCGYCTFAVSPRQAGAAYLSPDQVLAIARAGREAGCREALFTLGDKPELRYEAARSALRRLGHASTIEYLLAMCELVVRETGLLPHVNAGIATEAEIAALRRVSVSQGIMLENASPRLAEPAGPHFGSPDKDPTVRIAMIEAAGRQHVPFTSGILIGIGETRRERILSLLVLGDLHARHGHLQEIIIQNFRAKPGTRMAGAAEPSLEDVLWTAATARLVLGPAMNIQVPPNLSFDAFPRLASAGINDWGGISPVTADHVNPEAPWPSLVALERATAAAGYTLVQRLAVYPNYACAAERWLDRSLASPVLDEIDATGFAREDAWVPGAVVSPPPTVSRRRSASMANLLDRAAAGQRLEPNDIVHLFAARGAEVDEICAAADALRAKTSGDIVRYVVNRNINYTNVCSYSCSFCAFSKGKRSDDLRGRPYDLALEEVARRTVEAWDRGATEVCLQGGIHPAYTGDTYLTLLRTVKEAVPAMHVHAFSPLEVSHGAQTLGLSLRAFLERLHAEGLGSLPGTAAEILDDEVRARICPDKLDTRQWLEVVETAHRTGLRTTATIMFGHVEGPRSWAAHLLHIRDLQERSGGLTEFVPLPFVHMEAPMYLRGQSRKGPTWRETLLMHAVSRLALHPLVTNVQASWVKLGPAGVARVLNAGVNDCGGTLMNESISRAAGTLHGQELPPERMEELIREAGRVPRQRTTLYREVAADRYRLSFGAPALAPVVQTPLRRPAMRSSQPAH